MSTLFDLSEPPRPRQRPRKLMHVVDAGEAYDPDADVICKFRCNHCGCVSEWLHVRTVTEAKRGLPCPKCNEEPRQP